MNNCNFAGNIGQDCRVNTINGNNGQITVVNFSLATDKKKKDNNGNKQTLWIDCAIWGKRAEALQQYLLKGQKVAVSGSVDVDMFTKNDGQTIPKLNLMVNELTLMGSASNGGSQQQQGNYQQAQTQQHQGQQSAPQTQTQQGGRNLDFDDDIPFSPIGLQYRGILNAM